MKYRGIPRARLQLDIEVDGANYHAEYLMTNVSIEIKNHLIEVYVPGNYVQYEVAGTVFKIEGTVEKGTLEKDDKTNEQLTQLLPTATPTEG